MAKYIVDLQSVTTHTYEVEADSPEEAVDRYSDGQLSHSEASGFQVINVEVVV